MTAAAFVFPRGEADARPFRLLRASTEPDLRVAASFRRDVFLERRGVTFDDLLEARRDREGHVLLLLDGNRPVATARVLPFPSRLSALPGRRIDHDRIGVDSEVGRIAAVRSSEGMRHAATLLALGAAWLLEHTTLRRYVAHCHPRLLGLYRLAGAEVVGGPFTVPGRAEAHLLIAGRYENAARSGRSA